MPACTCPAAATPPARAPGSLLRADAHSARIHVHEAGLHVFADPSRGPEVPGEADVLHVEAGARVGVVQSQQPRVDGVLDLDVAHPDILPGDRGVHRARLEGVLRARGRARE